MARDPYRFRLARAGVLNVWQYDEQVFVFADGRMLLRGTNGAGKSKTLEMLLPFVLDGDRARMAASGRQGSQLLWLMQDGASGGGTRTGYLWVELARVDAAGERTVLTCAVGIRHSASAKTATTWAFTVPTGVPELCEPDGTPLSAPRCRELVTGLGGAFFDAPRAYREHVGRTLFGLEPHAYDDLLRLLYWLRQPQVGEDIDPRRLVEMLDEALPALDEDAVRQVGESLDDLAEHGERLRALQAAAEAVQGAAVVYGHYAATLVGAAAAAALEAERDRAARSRALTTAERTLEQVTQDLSGAASAQADADAASRQAAARVGVLEAGPLARHQKVLDQVQRRAGELQVAGKRSRGWAEQALDRAAASGARVADEQGRLAASVAGLAGRVREAAGRLHACGLTSPLPPVDGPTLGGLVAAVAPARAETSRALAAAAVVRGALDSSEALGRSRAAAAERAAEAEQQQEQAAGRLADAAREVADAGQAWLSAAQRWVAEQPGLQVPVEVRAAALDALPALARAAAAPELARLRAAEVEAGARLSAAAAQMRELTARRTQVTAERDPAPLPPALPRPGRDPATGTPLWRLVDVQAGVDGAVLARVEAALEASGLLDAQVLADGSVLAAGALDTILLPGPAPETDTLAALLRPGATTDGPVGRDAVAAVLQGVALLDQVTGTGQAAVGRDGSWRLGTLTGRADKPRAQYVGVVAREAERARRLAEVIAALETAEQQRDAAEADGAEAAAGRAAVEGWLSRRPADLALRRAWVREDERAAAHDRAQAVVADTAQRLAAATEAAARAGEALRRLAAEHALPADAGALAARTAELRDLDRRLELVDTEAARVLDAARRLEEDREAAEGDADQAAQAADAAGAAERDADAAQEESRALRDSLGLEVARLQDELDSARRDLRAARADGEGAAARVLELTGRRGEELARVQSAAARLREALPHVAGRAAAVAALLDVPGLLPAALGRPVEEPERTGLAGAGQSSAEDRGHGLAREAVAVLRAWSALVPERIVDANAVHAEVRSLAAGPAADREPRVVPVGDALAVLARDDTGAEQPLAQAAERLAAAVTRERELLTDRERTLFEEHLLGELGDRLRARQAEAADLVRGMNDLLDGVRTSQGIRVRLDWQLRDDAGPEVREAVALLGRTHGSLTPDERSRLRSALGALIEVQRSAEPESGYTEHLARALDYRRWSAFAVRLHRPDATSWTTLTRRTPLSQGEQKVVCYLPLFAAAAAHFTSVAGAAAHAPRLILLDDAFPKIDVRTHPLLFGLLVDLDLDFVITSERLWGDHDTVPSLAIYEALRSPGERGIAQYRYVWDGRTLVGEGG